MTDTRFVYGANCAWFGPIQAIGRRQVDKYLNIPCCPYCGGMLFEMPTAKDWWKEVDKFEAANHPGYRKFIEWMADKHFFSFGEAEAAYVEAGNEVTW